MSNLPAPDADFFSLNELFKAGAAPLEAAEKMRKCSYVCNCLTWSLKVIESLGQFQTDLDHFELSEL